jgi:hypothetical protein
MKPLLTLLVSVGLSSAVAQSPNTFELAFTPPGAVGYSSYMDGAVAPDGSMAVLTGNLQITESQFIITRLHPDGSVAWSRQVTTSVAGAWMEPRKVIFTSDGQILCFGLFFAQTGNQYFLSRLSGEGELLWSRSYAAGSEENAGDYGSSNLHATSDGGAALCLGMLKKTVAVRVDATGAVQWARSYVTSESPTEKNPGFDFAMMPDGGMLLTEKAEGDIFLVRTDAAGDLLWSQRYPNGLYNHPKMAIALTDGGYLVAGIAGLLPFAMRLDSYGGVIWAKQYTLDEVYVEGFEQAVELEDGDFLLTPTANSIGLLGLRVSPLGAPVNATMLPGTSSYADIMGQHNGEVLAGGVISGYDDLGNLISTYPVLRLPSTMDMACGTGTTYATAMDIPFPTAPTSGCTVQEETIGLVELITYATEQTASRGPLCAAVTGLHEVPPTELLTATPTLLSAGTPLFIDLGEGFMAGSIEHFISDGRSDRFFTFKAQQGRMEINTTNWVAGMHTVRVLDGNGAFIGTVRVLVH